MNPLNGALNNIPPDIRGLIYSLAFPSEEGAGLLGDEAKSEMCQHMLGQIRKMPKESFLHKIYARLGERELEADRKIAKIKTIAIQLIVQGRAYLKPTEWSRHPQNPYTPASEWTLDEINDMANSISTARANHLIKFFQSIGTKIGAAETFLATLENLNEREKAVKIRTWMANNQLELRRIQEIEIPSIPKEILFLQNLNQKSFVTWFKFCCKDGTYETVAAIIRSGRFESISEYDLGEAFMYASKNGHLPVVQEIIRSGRFESISEDDLGEAFMYASKNGHLPVVQEIINPNRKEEIDQTYLVAALNCASENGHLPVVQAIFGFSPKIPKEDLEEALNSASENGHLPVVQEIARYGDISEVKGLSEEESSQTIFQMFDALVSLLGRSS